MKNDADSIVVARALDKLRESEYAPAVTDFMTPAEKCTVYSELSRLGEAEKCFFWGGYPEAERCMAVFLPDWYLPENPPIHQMPTDGERAAYFARYLAASSSLSLADELPISSLRIKGSGFKCLSHRDFMGGILSLGIERSVVGDIAVVSEAEAVVFVHDRIREYILDNLTKIGRDGVRTELIPPNTEQTISRSMEEIVINISSPRLDVVVKAITGKSREVSAETVRAGFVELSYRTVENVSEEVKTGDVISVRGYGKYITGDIIGQTKSGRLKMILKKYV